jgi:hypothetical protein
MIDYAAILSANYAGKQWTLEGDNYDGLTWLDSTPKPTQAELDQQWEEVKTVIANAIAEKISARQAVLEKLGLSEAEVASLFG